MPKVVIISDLGAAPRVSNIGKLFRDWTARLCSVYLCAPAWAGNLNLKVTEATTL